jgi:hypothetical protein
LRRKGFAKRVSGAGADLFHRPVEFVENSI